MNGSSLNELLESLGLTEYESKTLSTLFGLSEAEAPQISRRSQVPKTRVYDVLDKLVKRNLVIEIRGRPKKYRILDARKVLDSLITDKKTEIMAIEDKAKTFADSLIAMEQSKIPGSGETVMKVKDTRDFEKILSQEIEKAENHVMAFSEITDKHNVLSEAITKAKEKNVVIKMLNHFPNTLVKKSVKDAKHFEHGLNAFIIDGKKVVMALSDFKSEQPEYHFTIWHDNKPMANALKHYFDKLWTQGKKL
ncbi:MAG: hypothetical protein CL943_01500 [Candidatus Diapherotrites archaeon]|uniref:Transcription regulator TrmB N-terminal domain-containing protein n=1 Tax=Candidatus Iainarchaeum sp. TaxID=3101447 RepID=A0A2D6M0M3_9ARCH|nr:hypothetical protein [Candidatus Diapherotrites archaeon]|tara:strand:- start:7704 stop:8453 length:750 start_codon:yes stop_codon:yes gene_type:complete